MKWISSKERLPKLKETVFLQDIKDSKYIICDVGELHKDKSGEIYFSGTSRSYPVNHENYDVYWLDESQLSEGGEKKLRPKQEEEKYWISYGNDGAWLTAEEIQNGYQKLLESTEDYAELKEALEEIIKHEAGGEDLWDAIYKAKSILTK